MAKQKDTQRSATLGIKSWSEDDRPREKMMSKGRNVLTDAELIAILIGSGSRDESAVDLAKRILSKSDNDLHKLAHLSLNDLMRFKGIGEAKAITIAAALELGRRRKNAEKTEKVKIASSKDAYELLFPHLSDLDHEQFYAILLNRSNLVIDVVKIGQGGVSGTLVDPKIVFKAALDRLASSIIVAHNHPSGNLSPSNADLNITKKLVAAGEMLEINVVDHLIVTDHQYMSFSDKGLL